MKKINKLVLIIVLLVILIIGLTSYIVYEKVLNDNSNSNCLFSDKKDDSNNEVNLEEKDDSNNENNLEEKDDSNNESNLEEKFDQTDTVGVGPYYIDGKITAYYKSSILCDEHENTYSFSLASDEINNFYIGGSIFEYADMVIQNGKININTYLLKEKNNLNSGKDSNYASRTYTIEIKEEQITKIISIANSNFSASYLFVLTEKGNVYVSKYNNVANTMIDFEKISNFKKLEISNVSEIIKVNVSGSCSHGLPKLYAHDSFSDNFINISNL